MIFRLICNIQTLAAVLILVVSVGLKAQSKTYLSGTYADTAIDWEFKISEGRNSGYWTTIPVPSNWETKGFGHYAYGNDHKDYLTNPEIGYYKHQFDFNKSIDQRYFIVFQGSMTETTVVLNGEQIGETHVGGFTEFKYEITDFLKNGNNLLEVEVLKSSKKPQVHKAERISDFWLFGGIFRPVYIEEVPSNFIERVAINALADGDLDIEVFTDINNEQLGISAQVYDAERQKIGSPILTTINNNTGKLSTKFENIRQWSHELPKLYRVKIDLISDGKIIHSYNQKFGFRTFEVRDHDGFYLNGKRILLKGANMHSFSPETGRTLSKENMLENVRIMQELNFNTVRICHYPPDSEFLDLCDSLGLLVMDELPGWRHHLPTDIGEDITEMKEVVKKRINSTANIEQSVVKDFIIQATAVPVRPTIQAVHYSETHFNPGIPLTISLEVSDTCESVSLYYRHVNQSEYWQSVLLGKNENVYTAEIPASFTDNRFPIQYYFEIKTSPTNATMFPHLADDLATVPYFLVRRKV